MSENVELIAAREELQDLPASVLVGKLIEARSEALRNERNCDKWMDRCNALSAEVAAAKAVLNTVVRPVGENDLLTFCELARVAIAKSGETPF